MNLIIFDEMVIAMKVNGRTGGIINQAVLNAIAHAVNVYSRLIGPIPPVIRMDDAIRYRVVGWNQRFAVPSSQADSPGPQIVKGTILDAMITAGQAVEIGMFVKIAV
jgi:hypothetical protein